MNFSNEELLQAANSLEYPSLWALTLKTSNGLPFEFDNHRFMIDFLDDMSPLQVLLKPPQIGASETEFIKACFVAKKYKKDIIYTLPTQGDVYDMVGGKFNRIVAQNPTLMEWVKDHDSVEQKQIGQSMIYLRGTFTSKQAMMVSSGLNIHDETDASDQSVITQYETRLQAQSDGWRWYFSHPSLAGHGVDVYWQQSDKKEWYIQCPSCQEQFYLEWPRNIENEKYVCHLCKAELPDNARRNGEWRATSEGVFSGYHVSQLMCPWISAKKIVEAFNDPLKTKQYFYNYVLGLPYIGGDDVIAPATVLKNCVDEVNDQSSRIIIGVDTGLPIHYVCLNKDGVFYYSTCDNYSQLEKLLTRWPKSILVSDQGGDLIGIRELQQKYPGRVFLCYYQKDKKSPEIVRWGEGDDYGVVKVDRNNMLTLMVEQLRDIGRIRLNGTIEDWQPFAKHFGNIYREKILVKETKDKDDRSLYGNEYVWKRNGADHYVHTLLYAIVGLGKYGESLATIVSKAIDRSPRGITVGTDNFNSVILSDY